MPGIADALRRSNSPRSVLKLHLPSKRRSHPSRSGAASASTASSASASSASSCCSGALPPPRSEPALCPCAEHPLEISLALPPGRLRRKRGRGPLRPFCVLLGRSVGGAWEMLGRTETVEWEQRGVRFVAKLKMDWASPEERRRELRVEVFDRRCRSERIEDQTFIGRGSCVVEELLSKQGWQRSVVVSESLGREVGQVMLSADVIRAAGELHQVAVGIELASAIRNGMRVFYVLSRALPSGEFTPVYRSEVLEKHEKRFKAVTRSAAVLAAGAEDKMLRIELYKFSAKGDHSPLGFAQLSIAKLRAAPINSSVLWWPARHGLHIGRVTLVHRKSSSAPDEEGRTRTEFGFKVTQ